MKKESDDRHYMVEYLDRLFTMKKDKGWDYLYFMIDIHNTVIKPTYDKSTDFEFFPYAKETLQLICRQKDIKTIMWTSTYPDIINQYEDKFWEYGIVFDFVNENPDFEDDYIRCFIDKFYYDIGFDDKFGFDAETDWKEIYDYLKTKGW